MKKRKILLVEPNYKNKYPPMGLMKLATYFRSRGDDVRFFKGDLKDLAIELTCEDLLLCLEVLDPNIFWKDYWPQIKTAVQKGQYSHLADIECFQNNVIIEKIKEYHSKYYHKDYFNNPRFDKVCITTLFTFYWKITIDTINFAKKLCKKPKNVFVGGIMATLLPDEVFAETGIHPIVGLLDKPGILDRGNSVIIDELPLDYSILDEIDYKYPTHNAYFAYTTRGCINKCAFCAVPILEPTYRHHINLTKQIEATKKRFGEQQDLMLLDNNVLASQSYDDIIEEIKSCGFAKDIKYTAPNFYEIAIRNLKDNYNSRAYVKKIVSMYKLIAEKLGDSPEGTQLYLKLEEAHCLHDYSATRTAILNLDSYFRPLFNKFYKVTAKLRSIDFNQGVDSRLISDVNMRHLSELSINPLRIAFDHWELRDVYQKSVRVAVSHGIKHLSNYLLYNFQDKPEHLYQRLKMNVDLCEELDATIYSFPMKYHPIKNPQYFRNRDYIGDHWNRKYIRAIQAVLNSTKGKIGRGKAFFEEAFGKDLNEFNKILLMPETFIIYRRKYDAELRNRMKSKYADNITDACDLTNEWWDKFQNLSSEQQKTAEDIIKLNKFSDDHISTTDQQIREVLSYYQLPRK